ncbi:hypothetical protein DRN86_01315 [Candidatus Geothermarchaeota archaeon]|nr:MAG: hypothetical protein DRN86_01315 [Candidatus Geothermarchaeota archaeon]
MNVWGYYPSQTYYWQTSVDREKLLTIKELVESGISVITSDYNVILALIEELKKEKPVWVCNILGTTDGYYNVVLVYPQDVYPAFVINREPIYLKGHGALIFINADVLDRRAQMAVEQVADMKTSKNVVIPKYYSVVVHASNVNTLPQPLINKCVVVR